MKNRNLLVIGKLLVLLFVFSGFVFAQTIVVKTPVPKPAPKKIFLPKDKESPIPPPTPTDERRVANEDDLPYEKSVEVENEVAINLEVCEGKVRINGWDREEVRVFVSGGSKVGFRTAQPKRKNGKTASITILGYDPKVDKGGNLSNCLYGDEIELDVPHGARISKLEGRDANISINSVSKVTVLNYEGNVALSEIEEGITATAYNGNISVENSSGIINLNSSEGNIFVYDTDSFDVGDALSAKSGSGSVILQSINHSMVSARSISGLVKFRGELKTDGQYRFENTSGQIVLEIPENSSCLFEAIVAQNRFSANEFQFIRFDRSKVDSTLQKIIAQIGEGEANISLQNGSGKITFVKMK